MIKTRTRRTLAARLDAIERAIPKRSVFPKWPPVDLTGSYETRRQVYMDFGAQYIEISRRLNYPPHPESADRLKLEAFYRERRQKQPEFIRDTHPEPLDDEELQQMLDEYNTFHGTHYGEDRP